MSKDTHIYMRHQRTEWKEVNKKKKKNTRNTRYKKEEEEKKCIWKRLNEIQSDYDIDDDNARALARYVCARNSVHSARTLSISIISSFFDVVCLHFGIDLLFFGKENIFSSFKLLFSHWSRLMLDKFSMWVTIDKRLSIYKYLCFVARME